MCKVIGINIGYYATNIGIVDKQGNILEEITISTEMEMGTYIILNKIFNVIYEFSKNYNISAIGIHCLKSINAGEATVEDIVSAMLDWRGIDIKKEIEKGFSVPIVLGENLSFIKEGEILVGCSQKIHFKTWLDELVKEFKDILNCSIHPRLVPVSLLKDKGLLGAAELAFRYLQ